MAERRSLRVLAFLWLLWMAAAAGAAVVRDDRGMPYQGPKAPQRVVSLLPALSEMVCELGACARLVGVDLYSNWPDSLRRLPRTSGMEDANLELIVSLRPDVVLLSASSRLMDRLRALGVAVMVLDPTTLEDVPRVMRTLAELLELPDAARHAHSVWQRVESGVAAAARDVPADMRGARVYFEVDAAPYAAGPTSFAGQLLQRLGLRNIVPADLGPFPKLNPEFVVRADPQIILLTEHQASRVSERPGWSRIQAVRSHRLCEFAAAQGDVMVRPGPRMDEAARLVVACLQRIAKGRAS